MKMTEPNTVEEAIYEAGMCGELAKYAIESGSVPHAYAWARCAADLVLYYMPERTWK